MPDYADPLHRCVNDRGESGGQVGRAGALEVVRGGGIVSGEDVAGVVEGHLLQGSQEDLFGLGSGLFGGSIHSDFKFVHFAAQPDETQASADRLQPRRKGDFDGVIL